MTTIPHVVYHVAAMGNWPEVVAEQLLAVRKCGLGEALAEIGDSVRITYVGDPAGQQVVLDEAARQDVPVQIIRSDPNVLHYETFAMLEIERLAKVEHTDRPILYFHTKGVSNPGHNGKVRWRRLMSKHVIGEWRENVHYLAEHDAVGVNWHSGGEQHFSGTFWVARAEWIRQLPDFVSYHHAKHLVRYSCETWIGAHAGCRSKSLVCSNEKFWDDHYDFDRFEILGRFDYLGLGVQQSREAFPAFERLLAALKPARILEIGTGEGGFSLFLRHVLDAIGERSSVLTVDVTERHGYGMVRTSGVDVRVADVFGPSYRGVCPAVERYINGPGMTLVLVDGGQKDKEFAAVARCLKPGDFIGVHDYAPDRQYFDHYVAGRTWNWLEFTDADAAGPAAAHHLTIDHPHRDELMAVHWYLARKERHSEACPVSVCIATIPTRRQLLLRALDSVYGQTLPPAEVSVAVDYKREGAAATKNRAIRAANQPWVAVLDDDDEFDPIHLAELILAAEKHGADVVYSGCRLVDESGKELPRPEEAGRFGQPFDPDLLRKKSYIPTTCLARTELAVRVGFQCPPGSPYDDWGFYLGLLDAGAKFYHLPKTTWKWNIWKGNTSGNPTRW